VSVALAAWRGLGWALTPLLRLWVQRRRARGKEHAARWPERFGHASADRPPGRLIWLHAASVGESLSALPVIDRLVALGPVLVTTGTVTSAALMAERLPVGASHQFAPLDLPGPVARFLDHWQPDGALWIESELWPGMLGALAERRVPAALVNGRLSARSHRRWRRAPGLARIPLAAFTTILARGPEDAGRFADLGRSALCVGDLKAAAAPLPVDQAALALVRARLGAAPVWVAASLHPGEEAIVAEVHRRLTARWPGLTTILVPRHPVRGSDWAAALGCGRRGAGAQPTHGAMYIADTLGELGLWYRLAPIAFVGGSLVARGGQNPLEPARLGAAVLFGPDLGNFAEIADRLVAGGAARRVRNADDLAATIDRLLADETARKAMSEAALAAAASEAAVIDRVLARLDMIMPHSASMDDRKGQGVSP
jgi:3-deoxy-D-manno-octulosonic-acid transferase